LFEDLQEAELEVLFVNDTNLFVARMVKKIHCSPFRAVIMFVSS